MAHLELPTLEAGLAHVRLSPIDDGRVELIARRPADDRREVLTEAELSIDTGLVGDKWSVARGGTAPNPDAQLTLMNARVAALVAAVAAAALAPFVVDPPTAAVIAGIALLIILRHHANIRRLIAGTESRISLTKG